MAEVFDVFASRLGDTTKQPDYLSAFASSAGAQRDDEAGLSEDEIARKRLKAERKTTTDQALREGGFNAFIAKQAREDAEDKALKEQREATAEDYARVDSDIQRRLAQNIEADKAVKHQEENTIGSFWQRIRSDGNESGNFDPTIYENWREDIDPAELVIRQPNEGEDITLSRAEDLIQARLEVWGHKRKRIEEKYRFIETNRDKLSAAQTREIASEYAARLKDLDEEYDSLQKAQKNADEMFAEDARYRQQAILDARKQADSPVLDSVISLLTAAPAAAVEVGTWIGKGINVVTGNEEANRLFDLSTDVSDEVELYKDDFLGGFRAGRTEMMARLGYLGKNLAPEQATIDSWANATKLLAKSNESWLTQPGRALQAGMLAIAAPSQYVAASKDIKLDKPLEEEFRERDLDHFSKIFADTGDIVLGLPSFGTWTKIGSTPIKLLTGGKVAYRTLDPAIRLSKVAAGGVERQAALRAANDVINDLAKFAPNVSPTTIKAIKIAANNGDSISTALASSGVSTEKVAHLLGNYERMQRTYSVNIRTLAQQNPAKWLDEMAKELGDSPITSEAIAKLTGKQVDAATDLVKLAKSNRFGSPLIGQTRAQRVALNQTRLPVFIWTGFGKVLEGVGEKTGLKHLADWSRSNFVHSFASSPELLQWNATEKMARSMIHGDLRALQSAQNTKITAILNGGKELVKPQGFAEIVTKSGKIIHSKLPRAEKAAQKWGVRDAATGDIVGEFSTKQAAKEIVKASKGIPAKLHDVVYEEVANLVELGGAYDRTARAAMLAERGIKYTDEMHRAVQDVANVYNESESFLLHYAKQGGVDLAMLNDDVIDGYFGRRWSDSFRKEIARNPELREMIRGARHVAADSSAYSVKVSNLPQTFMREAGKGLTTETFEKGLRKAYGLGDNFQIFEKRVPKLLTQDFKNIGTAVGRAQTLDSFVTQFGKMTGDLTAASGAIYKAADELTERLKNKALQAEALAGKARVNLSAHEAARETMAGVSDLLRKGKITPIITGAGKVAEKVAGETIAAAEKIAVTQKPLTETIGNLQLSLADAEAKAVQTGLSEATRKAALSTASKTRSEINSVFQKRAGDAQKSVNGLQKQIERLGKERERLIVDVKRYESIGTERGIQKAGEAKAAATGRLEAIDEAIAELKPALSEAEDALRILSREADDLKRLVETGVKTKKAIKKFSDLSAKAARAEKRFDSQMKDIADIEHAAESLELGKTGVREARQLIQKSRAKVALKKDALAKEKVAKIAAEQAVPVTQWSDEAKATFTRNTLKELGIQTPEGFVDGLTLWEKQGAKLPSSLQELARLAMTHIPEEHARMYLESLSIKSPNKFLKTLDGIRVTLQRSLLANPASLARDVLGNVGWAAVHGVTPADVAEATKILWQGSKQNDFMAKWLKNPIEESAELAGRKAQLEASGVFDGQVFQEALFKNPVDIGLKPAREAVELIREKGQFGAFLQATGKAGLSPLRAFGKTGKKLATAIPEAAGTASGKFFNGFLEARRVQDAIFRTALYLNRTKKGFSHAAATEDVFKVFGNFSELAKLEKSVLQRIFFFYSWQRHALGAGMKLMFERPFTARMMMTLNAGNVRTDPDTQEWMKRQGGWIMGKDNKGNQQFLQTGIFGFMQPLSSVMQSEMMNEAFRRKDTLGNFFGLAQGVIESTVRSSAPPIRQLVELGMNKDMFSEYPLFNELDDPFGRVADRAPAAMMFLPQSLQDFFGFKPKYDDVTNEITGYRMKPEYRFIFDGVFPGLSSGMTQISKFVDERRDDASAGWWSMVGGNLQMIPKNRQAALKGVTEALVTQAKAIKDNEGGKFDGEPFVMDQYHTLKWNNRSPLGKDIQKRMDEATKDVGEYSKTTGEPNTEKREAQAAWVKEKYPPYATEIDLNNRLRSLRDEIQARVTGEGGKEPTKEPFGSTRGGREGTTFSKAREERIIKSLKKPFPSGLR